MQNRIIVGVGGTLAVLATLYGGAALASADSPAPSPWASTAQAGWGAQRGARAGMGDGRGYGASANAADLAARLGVSQDAVSAALANWYALNPDLRGRAMTTEQQAAAHEKLATFLAGELSVDRATVLRVLDARQESRRAERTEQLRTDLEAAVKDGRLTRAQADAILAAHESGAVRGGPGWGMRR